MMDSHLSEFHSGYRAYSVAALKHLPFELNSNDFHFDTEIIVQLMSHGFRIKEVPIPTYYGDEICYVNGLKYAKDVFRTTLDYRLHVAGFKHVPKYEVAPERRYPNKLGDPMSSHSKIAARVRPGATVLDVGAGSGVLGEALKARGAWVMGIDLTRPPGAGAVYDRFSEQDIDQGMLLPADLRFDEVVLADVLEHVRRPRALLEAVRGRLKPGGRIIASTGNVALWYYRLSLLFGRFEYRPRGILDEMHLKLYTLDSFKALVESAGLRVTDVDVTPIPLPTIHPAFGRVPLSWLHRLAHRAARAWKRMFAYQFILEAEPIEKR
jgi:2-polyprenyl-3-methyl-5-hydroxy-6-metoxy-1,4-benzoquinol methylase